MYAELVEEEKKSSRIVFPERLRKRWWALIDRKGTTQQKAIERLIEFVLEQDDLTQSMILGQVEANKDLARITVERMVAKRRGLEPD